MNKYTQNKRYAQLLQELQRHPHKDEIVNIMSQQLADSNCTYTIASSK